MDLQPLADYCQTYVKDYAGILVESQRNNDKKYPEWVTGCKKYNHATAELCMSKQVHDELVNYQDTEIQNTIKVRLLDTMEGM